MYGVVDCCKYPTFWIIRPMGGFNTKKKNIEYRLAIEHDLLGNPNLQRSTKPLRYLGGRLPHTEFPVPMGPAGVMELWTPEFLERYTPEICPEPVRDLAFDKDAVVVWREFRRDMQYLERAIHRAVSEQMFYTGAGRLNRHRTVKLKISAILSGDTSGLANIQPEGAPMQVVNYRKFVETTKVFSYHPRLNVYSNKAASVIIDFLRKILVNFGVKLIRYLEFAFTERAHEVYNEYENGQRSLEDLDEFGAGSDYSIAVLGRDKNDPTLPADPRPLWFVGPFTPMDQRDTSNFTYTRGRIISLRVKATRQIVRGIGNPALLHLGFRTLFFRFPQLFNKIDRVLKDNQLKPLIEVVRTNCLWRSLAMVLFMLEGKLGDGYRYALERLTREKEEEKKNKRGKRRSDTLNRLLTRRASNLKYSFGKMLAQHFEATYDFTPEEAKKVGAEEAAAVDVAGIEPSVLEEFIFRLSPEAKKHLVRIYFTHPAHTLSYEESVVIEKPTENITAGVLIFGAHAMPLLPHIKNLSPGLLPDPDKREHEIYLPVPIPESPHMMLTYDIETYQPHGEDGPSVVYSVQVCDGESSREFFLLNNGPQGPQSDVWRDFLSWLYDWGRSRAGENRERKRAVLYAHNSAKFDAKFLFKWIMDNYFMGKVRVAEGKEFGLTLMGNGVIVRAGGVLSINLLAKYERNKVLFFSFRDSLQFALGSLRSLAKAYNLPIQKEDRDHQAIRTLEDVWALREDSYGKTDVEVLYQIMEKTRASFHEVVPSMDIMNHVTIAGFARTYYLGLRLPRRTLYKPPVVLNAFVRKYFRGGVVQTGIQGYVDLSSEADRTRLQSFYTDRAPDPERRGVIYGLDFTSLYPYIMSEFPMPVGRSSVRTGNTVPVAALQRALDERDPNLLELDSAPFFFVMIRWCHRDEVVDTIEKGTGPATTTPLPLFWVQGKQSGTARPYIWSHNGHRDFWPKTLVNKNILQYVASDPDLFGMEIEVLPLMIVSDSGSPFKETVRTLFAEKARLEGERDEARERGDGELAAALENKRKAYKLLLNSSYGSFAMKGERKIIYSFSDSADSTEASLASFFENYTVTTTERLVGNRVRMEKIFMSRVYDEPSVTNLLLASTITLGAAQMFHALRTSIRRGGGVFLVGDTDSAYAYFTDEAHVHRTQHLVLGRPLSAHPVECGPHDLGGLSPELIGKGTCEEFAVVAPKVYGYRMSESGAVLKFKGFPKNTRWRSKREAEDEVALIGPDAACSFAKRGEEGHYLTWEDFKKYSSGEFKAVRAELMTFRAGPTEIVEKGVERLIFEKKFGRTVRKGVVQLDSGGSHFFWVRPRIWVNLGWLGEYRDFPSKGSPDVTVTYDDSWLDFLPRHD